MSETFQNFLYVVGFLIVTLIALAIYSEMSGSSDSYTRGIKDGYAEHCNLNHNMEKHINTNVHYEEGWGQGLSEAITHKCDKDYFKKLPMY